MFFFWFSNIIFSLWDPTQRKHQFPILLAPTRKRLQPLRFYQHQMEEAPIDPGGYRWQPTYSTGSKTIISASQFFHDFSGLKLPGPFWGPKLLYSSERPFQLSLKWLKRRPYAKVMLLAQSLLNMGIPWHIRVRRSQMQSTNIAPMIRRCITLYKPIDNGSIKFLERRQ